ncbi:MAG TPA: hypothetical protein VNJ51_06620 [Candidatus Dormibacteraeota bacterium]|nr:hypothetical protein [Candidatus Dormibacteraeota bacterium]
MTRDAIEAIELMYQAGWTDGLPVVPPYPEIVDQFVRVVGRPPEDVVACIPPLGGKATVAKVAANAVMAGCRPEYMPVIMAAIDAMLDDKFNLGGMQCSTHLSTPLLIINGPIRNELGINCGANVFGQGWRANATIGRAVKLILVNIGGAVPGVTDKATLGHPGKYTYCIGENEEESPWEPLHVERGFDRDESTVTVYGSEAPHNINNQMVDNPFVLLTTIGSMMANLGSNHPYLMGESFVALCPEHAEVCAGKRFRKADVKQYLFDNARNEHRRLKMGGIYGPDTAKYNTWPHWIDRARDDIMVPVCRRPEDISVIVTGGPGRHSAYLPGWSSRSATRKIQTSRSD